MYNVLIKQGAGHEEHVSIQAPFLRYLIWFQSFVGYLLVLPTLWEAIAFEGTVDRVLCFAVIWHGFGLFLSSLVRATQPRPHTQSFPWAESIRISLVLATVVLFCWAHNDDGFRLIYATFLLILSFGFPPTYGRSFLCEPLLNLLFGTSLLFTLGVVRHEWWYCELKGESCAAIASTHIVTLCALAVLLIVLFCTRENSLFIKSVRGLCGSLLLGVAIFFLLRDLSLNPPLSVTAIDSSVGLLCAIVLLIAPYVRAISEGALNSNGGKSSLFSASAFIVTSVLLIAALVPKVITFYRAPRLDQTESQVASAEFELCDELVTLLLTAEDPTFFFHSGVDFVRIRDAIGEALVKGSYGRGGSTLSMQLAKVLFLEYDKTFIRKLRQLTLGILLELSYSKELILREYLRVVPFAPGVVGIELAAQRFFGKGVAYLTREQFLRLVVAIFDPTVELYNGQPYTGEVSIRARTIDTREKVFRRALLHHAWPYDGLSCKN